MSKRFLNAYLVSFMTGLPAPQAIRERDDLR
jgi:hypothetical protein